MAMFQNNLPMFVTNKVGHHGSAFATLPDSNNTDNYNMTTFTLTMQVTEMKIQGTGNG
jgi:hypothetical protein